MSVCFISWFVFFFQAEDGIRDYKVTGVQTCALPIYVLEEPPFSESTFPLSSAFLYTTRSSLDLAFKQLVQNRRDPRGVTRLQEWRGSPASAGRVCGLCAGPRLLKKAAVILPVSSVNVTCPEEVGGLWNWLEFCLTTTIPLSRLHRPLRFIW